MKVMMAGVDVDAMGDYAGRIVVIGTMTRDEFKDTGWGKLTPGEMAVVRREVASWAPETGDDDDE